MARTGKILRGAGVGYLHQVLTTAVGLWLTTFLLARLGQEEYGSWLIVTQVLAYLLLMDLGVIALLPRDVAAASGRPESTREIHRVLSQTVRHLFLQLPVVALITAGLWLLLPQEWEVIRAPLTIVGIAFVVTFPLRLFQATLQGLQDLAAAGVIATTSWAAGTAVTVVLILRGTGINSLAYGWVATQVLLAALALIRLLRKHPEVLPSAWARLDRAYLKDRAARYGWVSLSKIGHVFLAGTDLLIIGKIMGPAATVPFFCTAKLVTVLANQPQLLLSSSAPALSQLRSEEGAERIDLASSALTQVMLILSGLIACVVLASNRGFVNWWVGDEFYGGTLLTGLLVGRTLLRHWNDTAQYANFAFGHDRHNSLVSLADGVVTVVASVALGSVWGLRGVVAGSIMSVAVVGIPVNLSKLASETGRTTLHHVVSLWPWAWRFGLVATLAYFASTTSLAGTLTGSAVFAVAIGAAYTVVMLPIALREPAGVYIKPRIERFLPAFLTR